MKRWHNVLIVLTLTGLLVSPALAAKARSKPGDTAKARQTRNPTTSPAAAKTVRGELTILNVETGILTVKTSRRQQTEDVTLTTNDKTAFSIDNVGVTLADLKLGMTVRVAVDSAGAVTTVDAQPLTKSQKKRSEATTKPSSATAR